MEAVSAIKGEDFVMMATTATTGNQDRNREKRILHPLGKYSMIMFRGLTDPESHYFKRRIIRKLGMFPISYGYNLAPKAATHFARTNLARFIRRRSNNQISMMIGGFDTTSGPELHYIDSNGTAAPIPYGVRGSRSEFSDELLRDQYKPNLKHEEAYMALKNCIEQIKQKFPGNTFNSVTFIIKNDGIKRMCLEQPSNSSASKRLH